MLYQKEPMLPSEIHKCSEDILYFVNKYCLPAMSSTIKTLTPYQESTLSASMSGNLKVIDAMWTRQKGNTTACLCYMLWKCMFSKTDMVYVGRNEMIMSETRRMMISMVTQINNGSDEVVKYHKDHNRFLNLFGGSVYFINNNSPKMKMDKGLEYVFDSSLSDEILNYVNPSRIVSFGILCIPGERHIIDTEVRNSPSTSFRSIIRG